MMELYNKDTLNKLKAELTDEQYYLPKVLFHSGSFANIRLETKLAYVAILDTLLNKANFNQEGLAFLKRDNPTIIATLAKLANKEVDNAKMEKYYDELCEAKLIIINKQDLFVYHLD